MNDDLKQKKAKALVLFALTRYRGRWKENKFVYEIRSTPDYSKGRELPLNPNIYSPEAPIPVANVLLLSNQNAMLTTALDQRKQTCI